MGSAVIAQLSAMFVPPPAAMTALEVCALKPEMANTRRTMRVKVAVLKISPMRLIQGLLRNSSMVVGVTGSAHHRLPSSRGTRGGEWPTVRAWTTC